MTPPGDAQAERATLSNADRDAIVERLEASALWMESQARMWRGQSPDYGVPMLDLTREGLADAHERGAAETRRLIGLLEGASKDKGV